ncbi:MAG TPA: M48 family metalloprotease [Gemmataceae bacterium]|nr:M48 family metalloprotease [Gemmataceae bacterium]
MNEPLAKYLKPLLILYYPFLLAICFLWLALAAGLALLFAETGLIFFLILAFLLVLPLLHALWALRVLAQSAPIDDGYGLKMPCEILKNLYRFVAEVAKERRCPPPAEIRLAAETVACVSEDGDGRLILVVGAIAISFFTQPALAGVVAHELAHYREGDTRFTRRARRHHLFMNVLHGHLWEQSGTKLNPLIWLVLGYHALYQRAWAADSREREYAADQYTVAQVGKEQAAATLIHLILAERLPWVRLSNVAKSVVETKLPVDQIFAEQRRRAQLIRPSEWQEACQNELRRRTLALDSHPSLKDRLKALKVSPKNALKYALDQPGPPAADLIPAWPGIERRMTEEIVAEYREAHMIKMELGQIYRRL